MSAPELRAVPSAADLLMAIGRQDRAAFADLFRLYAPKVKAFLIRRRASAPEELTQEVMLSIWRKAPSFDRSRGTADAWIFTIARNACIDAARREHGKVLLDLEFAPEESEPPRAHKELEAAETAVRIRKALDALTPNQLEVVRLSFFEDAPHSEISARLGLPLGTVKSRVRLALKRLKSLLDDQP